MHVYMYMYVCVYARPPREIRITRGKGAVELRSYGRNSTLLLLLCLHYASPAVSVMKERPSLLGNFKVFELAAVLATRACCLITYGALAGCLIYFWRLSS